MQLSLAGDATPADAILWLRQLGMKPPLEYHDAAFQQQLLRDGTREELIAWLCWNDSNGSYTDWDSMVEDRPSLTLEAVRQIVCEQLQRVLSD